MEEPTEEMKQAVIAYYKEQGFALYKTEGINKVYAELIEARELMENAYDEYCEISEKLNSMDKIQKFLNKQQ